MKRLYDMKRHETDNNNAMYTELNFLSYLKRIFLPRLVDENVRYVIQFHLFDNSMSVFAFSDSKKHITVSIQEI